MNNSGSNQHDQISTSIELLLKEFHEQVEDLSLFEVVTLRDKTRSLIWNLRCHFDLSHGVACKANRIFEKFVAALVRLLTKNAGKEYAGLVMTIVNPQLLLIVVCCFQLAAKSSNARPGVTYLAISKLFKISGVSEYSVPRIRDMRRDIFRKIGCRLPLFTCMDMAGMLATNIAVPPLTLRLAVAFAESAEINLHLIQRALLSLNSEHRIQARDRQITSLHLAASCVVAAVQSDLGLSEAMRAAGRLSVILKITEYWLKYLSKVILAETAHLCTVLYNNGLDN